MVWTDVPAIVAGDVWNASEWNAYLVDNFAAIGDAWTSYTPSWTASTSNPTLSNGTLTGVYRQVGKTVNFRILLTFGSSTSVGSGDYRFSLPVTAIAAGMIIGATLCVDSSTSDRRARYAYTDTTSRVVLMAQEGNMVTNSAPFTWATGDTITISGTYEAA